MSSRKLNPQKIVEAETHMKAANKYLEKTMFRWSPDYLMAAPELEKAAQAYRAGGDLNRSKHAHLQAANAQMKNKSTFKAAQHLETAAKLAIDIDPGSSGARESREIYEKAASYYRDMGELTKASDSLKKGAMALEEVNESEAIRLYMEACQLMEDAEKPHYAIETFRKTLAVLVQREKFKEAIQLIPRLVKIYRALGQGGLNEHKCNLSVTILHLTMGDIPAADKSFTEHLQDDAYLHSSECALAEDLITAFKNSSEEAIQQTIKKQEFNYLENQIGRLAKKLTLFGSRGNHPEPVHKSQSIAKMPSTHSTTSSSSSSSSLKTQDVSTSFKNLKVAYKDMGASSTSIPAPHPTVPTVDQSTPTITITPPIPSCTSSNDAVGDDDFDLR